MNYKIIGADTAIGQIIVRYVDEQGEGLADFAIDLPIIDGAAPTGDALEQIIQERAPVWLMERKAQIETADFSAIAALVESLPVVPSDPVGIMTTTDKLDILVEKLETVAAGVEARYITPRRQAAYLEKYRQARLYVAAGYAGTAPAYIAREAAETGDAPRLIADTIIAKFEQWHEVVNAQLEAIRVATKKKILAAATVADGEATLDAALARIRAL